MNPLYALYNTYNKAEQAGLVDKWSNENLSALLPIFHDNKRSKGNDIIEILLNERGDFLDAYWIAKDIYIVFPVSELSIGRSSGVAPHPLADKMRYVSRILSEQMAGKPTDNHHEKYIEQLKRWAAYEKTHPHQLLRSICRYLFQEDNDVLRDIIEVLSGNSYKSLGKGEYEFVEAGKNKKYNFSEIFVTFAVEFADSITGTLTVSRDVTLHQHFISYTQLLIAGEKQNYCDISGEKAYIAAKHRGLLPNAKVMSESNHYEIFRGRFRNGTEIVRVGLVTSQKVLLMLKYFLENRANGCWLSSGAYLINWFSNDISNSIGFQSANVMFQDNFLSDWDFSTTEEVIEQGFSLGGEIAHQLAEVITGNKKEKLEEINYYVMIIEKTSEGRIAIKYFRKYNGSQLAENVGWWYQTMSWPYYSYKKQSYHYRVPTLFSIVNVLYGEEQDNGNEFQIIGDQNKKRTGNLMEELVRCVMDRRPLPAEIAGKAWRNAKNRISYKKHWQKQLQTDCIILQKHLKDKLPHDYKHMKGEENLAILNLDNNDRSYLYGRLLAVYDRIENDAQYYHHTEQNAREEPAEGTERNSFVRPTNASKFWSAYIDRPSMVSMTLAKKVHPYLDRLKSTRPARAAYLEKLLGELIAQIYVAKEIDHRESLDEMFLFGYYAQIQDLFRSPKISEKDN